MNKHIATIQHTDAAKDHIKTFDGKNINICNLMGYIHRQDVGKRVYENERGILSVENQEQLEARLKQLNKGK